ncbi:MAG: restriction endonuclease subunit S [Oceanospirillaceae bacterium]|nr:restriction endonuclease subunit S [Oceanospirillaceae bacterium]
MSADWPIVRLEDITSILGDGLHGTPKYDENGEYFFINGNNLSNGKIVVNEKTKRATKDEFLKHRKQLNDRTVLVSINGTLGNVALYHGEKVFLGKSACYFNVNENIDRDYIRYVMSGSLFQNYIHSLATGSTIKNVSLKLMRDFSFSLPPLEEQRKISKILKNLDDKIELNRQTNQTLEQIAQAIFKSWFVDFEPTRAKLQVRTSVAEGRMPGSDRKLPSNFTKEDENHLVERAAMAAISGKSLEEINKLCEENDVQGSTNVAGSGSAGAMLKQLKETAALFPDALVESELGEIPEGWGVTKLGNIIEFNPKRTLRKGELAPYLDMKNVPTQGHLAEDVYLREMKSGTKFINGDTLLARITPCLENGKTAYVDFLEVGQVAWGSTEYIVMRPKGGRPMSLGYLIARLDSFRAKAIQTMTGTSGRQRANAKALSEQYWIDYPCELLDRFDLVASNYLNKAKINGDENKTLSVLRDGLLPKLLSGEININTEIAA